MNRRQFLGRFFQAVISARNSNSVYGIYHPWRQYDINGINLYIRLQYRSGDYLYSIPYISRDTIIAVYDGDNMIYCTAYYNKDTLVNNINTSICIRNLTPGDYTIKCLCYGKGLCQGESGDSISLTIPNIDRSSMHNNNYGYMDYPSVNVDFIFGISGLYFEAESVIDTVGKYYIEDPDLETSKLTYTIPSYAECLDAYNKVAIEHGITSKYTFFDYIDGVADSIPSPLTDEYRFTRGPMSYVHSKIKIIQVDPTGESDIGELDLKKYLGDYSDLWYVCDTNNIEYNPEKYYMENFNSAYCLGFNKMSRGLINNNGTIEEYYMDYYYPGFIDTDTSNNTADGEVTTGLYCPHVCVEYRRRLTNCSVQSVTLSTGQKSSNAYIDGTKYYGRSRLEFTITTKIVGENWTFYRDSTDPDSTSDIRGMYVDCRHWEEETLDSYIGTNLPKIITTKDNFLSKYWEPAQDYYGIMPSTQRTPWIDTTGLVDSSKRTISISIPVDALFGHLDPSKTMYPTKPPPKRVSDLQATYNETYNRVSLSWGNYIESEPTLKPTLEGFTMNLSEYDPDGMCNDSQAWLSINGRYVFLRQTTIPIDMGAIPDHQITH